MNLNTGVCTTQNGRISAETLTTTTFKNAIKLLSLSEKLNLCHDTNCSSFLVMMCRMHGFMVRALVDAVTPPLSCCGGC